MEVWNVNVVRFALYECTDSLRNKYTFWHKAMEGLYTPSRIIDNNDFNDDVSIPLFNLQH